MKSIIVWILQYWHIGILLSLLISVCLLIDSRPSKWSGNKRNIQQTWYISIAWFIINCFVNIAVFLLYGFNIPIILQLLTTIIAIIPIVAILIIVWVITYVFYNKIGRWIFKRK